MHGRGPQDGRNSGVEAVVGRWKRRLTRWARTFDHWQHPRKPAAGRSDKQVRCSQALFRLPAVPHRQRTFAQFAVEQGQTLS